MKKRLLIISKDQFGYHIDTYFYCKVARQSFDITYICCDVNREKIKTNGVTVKYISWKGNVLQRFLRLMFLLLAECRNQYDIVFVRYFVGCSILKILNPSMNFIFDIRTSIVVKNPIKRGCKNFVLRLESCFFKHITVISQSLADKLKLAKHKVHVLPIGAELVNVPDKQFDSLNLLYVGTFDRRRIEDTIEGFALFYAEYKDSIDISYDIVGDGYHGELEQLRQLVHQKGLDRVIRLPGYIHLGELTEYYDQCNVGVSYVPINDIYDCQPPTKTFEYIFAGMPVIATDTTENRRVINHENGVLVDDTPEAFNKGLLELYQRSNKFDSIKIKETCLIFSWENIISGNLVPFLESSIQRG